LTNRRSDLKADADPPTLNLRFPLFVESCHVVLTPVLHSWTIFLWRLELLLDCFPQARRYTFLWSLGPHEVCSLAVFYGVLSACVAKKSGFTNLPTFQWGLQAVPPSFRPPQSGLVCFPSPCLASRLGPLCPTTPKPKLGRAPPPPPSLVFFCPIYYFFSPSPLVLFFDFFF